MSRVQESSAMNLDSSLAGKNDLRCDTMRPHFHSRWCANGACSLIGIWDSAGCTVFSTDEWGPLAF
jgi:hypothetical protein